MAAKNNTDLVIRFLGSWLEITSPNCLNLSPSATMTVSIHLLHVSLWLAAMWSLVANHPQIRRRSTFHLKSHTFKLGCDCCCLSWGNVCTLSFSFVSVCKLTYRQKCMTGQKYSWWFAADIWSPDRTSTSINDQLMDQWCHSLSQNVIPVLNQA